jgi:hypothetical protein
MLIFQGISVHQKSELVWDVMDKFSAAVQPMAVGGHTCHDGAALCQFVCDMSVLPPARIRG